MGGASTQTQFGDSSDGRSVVSPMMAQPVAAPQPTVAAPLIEPGVDRRLHSVWVDIIDTTELKFGRRLGEGVLPLRCELTRAFAPNVRLNQSIPWTTTVHAQLSQLIMDAASPLHG